MSHRRIASHDTGKEPHAVSLKVLRLSRPTLAKQAPAYYPLDEVSAPEEPTSHPSTLAYQTRLSSNPEPFALSPALSLPVSFGSAYVGEEFSCTLCATLHGDPSSSGGGVRSPSTPSPPTPKQVHNVRIEAEMKTPTTTVKLQLAPDMSLEETMAPDLVANEPLQSILVYDLQEEGPHVLAVTVHYYETTGTSGRSRTFRKLYQFACKPSLLVRTKITPLPAAPPPGGVGQWLLEAQLENRCDIVMRLDRVGLRLQHALRYVSCNASLAGADEVDHGDDATSPAASCAQASQIGRAILRPGDIEHVCFVVQEGTEEPLSAVVGRDGRFTLGTMNISWRGEMGGKGSLRTGDLSSVYTQS